MSVPKTTIDGKALSPTAIANLSRFRAMMDARRTDEAKDEAVEARAKRAGVKVYTDEEKRAFLATRNDLA